MIKRASESLNAPVLVDIQPFIQLSTTTALARKSHDVSIDYLRLAVTLLVIVAHCTAPFTYVSQDIHRDWNSPIPIRYGGKWLGFDLLLLFADNCLMALMFFISALFAYGTLERRGVYAFLKERLRRLGLPFLAGTIILMPLAMYASYLMQYPGTGYFKYYRSAGLTQATPLWFLWMLMLLDFAMALIYVMLKPFMVRLRPFIEKLSNSPGVIALCTLVIGYILFYLSCVRFGFAYGSWITFLSVPFLYYQPSRLGIYILWASLGFLIGVSGLGNGLLARSGKLARRWPSWGLLGMVAFTGLCGWSVFTPLLPFPLKRWQEIYALFWVASTTTLCFFLLAFFRGFVTKRYRVVDRVSRTAYVMYLVHYAYLLWVEKWLATLYLPLGALVVISFSVTLCLSWITGELATRIPIIRNIV